MLVDGRGRPLPPAEITRRLQQIDPALHLRFVQDGDSGWWALAETWRQGDERYKLVQNGAMHPDDNWDMLGFLPKDCGADQAYGYLVNTLQSRAHTKDTAKKLLDRVHLYNKANESSVMEEMEAVAIEEADRQLGKKYTTKVYQTR